MGDLRGDVNSLIEIFRLCGFPPETKYLFLGNLVGHGPQSLEVLWTLFAYRITYPEHIFLLRGMNECLRVARLNGFASECKTRHNMKALKAVINTFNCMPLAALIDDRVFAVSGGLSPDLESLGQIDKVKRPIDVGI